MGRGSATKETKQQGVARRTDATTKSPAERSLDNADWFLRNWEFRAERAAHGVTDVENAKARALRGLTYNDKDQRLLIKIAQEATALTNDQSDEANRRLSLRAKRVSERARELFILCHTGFVEDTIGAYVPMIESDDDSHAREVLRQAARIGLNRAVDKYDLGAAAKPLTYARNWVRAEIKEETEHARFIRVKSNANQVAKRAQRAAKQIQNEGRQVTVAEIAKLTNDPVDKVAEVLPYATNSLVRLDAPVGDESDETIGSLTLDEGQRVDDPVLDADTRSRIREAVSAIKSPYQRRVIELFYGLADNESVEQNDLFDGIYVDKSTGENFTAEPSVLIDRSKKGIEVTKVDQRELNRRFADGELIFKPGTPESAELSRVAKGVSAEGPYRDFVDKDTGVPPTSGTVQEAKRQAEETLRSDALLEGIAPVYRGENELENSESARQRVRAALVSLGVADPKEAAKLRTGKAPSDNSQFTKSALRLKAEEAGLVDADSGRLCLAELAAVTEA